MNAVQVTHQPFDASGPEPPTEAAFRAVLRTIGWVERVMHPHFAHFGVSGAQWGVLRSLARDEAGGGDGLRLTDLSDRLLVRPPSVTGVVSRLERAGLVSRVVSVTDQRAKRVRLTAAGRDLLRRAADAHRAQVETVMAGLSADECDQLRRLLGRLGRHVETLAGACNARRGRAPTAASAVAPGRG